MTSPMQLRKIRYRTTTFMLRYVSWGLVTGWCCVPKKNLEVNKISSFLPYLPILQEFHQSASKVADQTTFQNHLPFSNYLSFSMPDICEQQVQRQRRNNPSQQLRPTCIRIKFNFSFDTSVAWRLSNSFCV